jgi:hypothetical protein
MRFLERLTGTWVNMVRTLATTNIQPVCHRFMLLLTVYYRGAANNSDYKHRMCGGSVISMRKGMGKNSIVAYQKTYFLGSGQDVTRMDL